MHAAMRLKQSGVDLRTRAVVLLFYYALPAWIVADVIGISGRSARRWLHLFLKEGRVERKERKRVGRWPEYVYVFVRHELEANPGLRIEELLEMIKETYPEVRNAPCARCAHVSAGGWHDHFQAHPSFSPTPTVSMHSPGLPLSYSVYNLSSPMLS